MVKLSVIFQNILVRINFFKFQYQLTIHFLTWTDGRGFGKCLCYGEIDIKQYLNYSSGTSPLHILKSVLFVKFHEIC